jgi:hypothetical protein
MFAILFTCYRQVAWQDVYSWGHTLLLASAKL